MLTFIKRPGPHADTALAVVGQLAQLKLWLACSRELMSCVGRLCKDNLYLLNSTTQRQLSATNPNSTTHNGSQHRALPDELEASPAGSRSDDYALAFLWYSAPPPPNFELFWSAAAAAAGLGWPEPPSLRSRSKQRSYSFRALPASKTSSVRTCAKTDIE